MAATLISRASALAYNLKSKAIGAAALVLTPDGSKRADATTSPTVSAGSGAPTEASPDGSLYLRTDGTDGTDSVYMRIAGAWVALAG